MVDPVVASTIPVTRPATAAAPTMYQTVFPARSAPPGVAIAVWLNKLAIRLGSITGVVGAPPRGTNVHSPFFNVTVAVMLGSELPTNVVPLTPQTFVP